MQLIIKGADFSANNIGRISQKAADFISEMGTQGEKASLIYNFISTIEVAGILAKMKKLYIPYATDNLSKMFTNVCSDDFTIDVAPNSSYFGVHQNGGVYRTAEGEDKNIIIPLSSEGLLNDSFTWTALCGDTVHILGGQTPNSWQYRTPPFSWSNSDGVRISPGDKAPGLVFNELKLAGRSITYNVETEGSYVKLNNSTDRMTSGMFGFTLKDNTFITADDSVITLDSEYTQKAVTENVSISSIGNNHTGMISPLLVVAFGQGLTAQEFEFLRIEMNKML